jgi:hypothetical protein
MSLGTLSPATNLRDANSAPDVQRIGANMKAISMNHRSSNPVKQSLTGLHYQAAGCKARQIL